MITYVYMRGKGCRSSTAQGHIEKNNVHIFFLRRCFIGIGIIGIVIKSKIGTRQVLEFGQNNIISKEIRDSLVSDSRKLHGSSPTEQLSNRGQVTCVHHAYGNNNSIR